MSHTTPSRPETEIVLCENCKGSGVIWGKRVTDYHRADVERTQHTCARCNGSGRMIRSSVETPYAPIAQVVES